MCSYGTVRANERLEVSAWIPYWSSAAGVADIMPHLDLFTEVNPFIYSLNRDGSLKREGDYADPQWAQLKAVAKAKNIRFIPTIISGDSTIMQEVLGNEELRRKHVSIIVNEVTTHDLDGIDIDYEGKTAQTSQHFSSFLNELSDALGQDKWLVCSIEARTPLDSWYVSPGITPADKAYANDFAVINKYCDRVRVMAYDQGRGDTKLNEKYGDPYIPVADTAWVEKVMRLTMADIDPRKLSVGVATYGYEYDMFNAGNYKDYASLGSFNQASAYEVASKLNITSLRNAWGEMQLLYTFASSNPASTSGTTRIMTWSDADAVEGKTSLAVRLGLGGVSVFKIDGGQDPKIWDVLSKYAIAPSSETYITTGEVLSTSVVMQEENIGVAPSSRDLSYGTEHADVRMLQKFLNEQGFIVARSGAGSPGEECNFFGRATRSALTRFQNTNGIYPSSGYYGRVTRAAMSGRKYYSGRGLVQ